MKKEEFIEKYAIALDKVEVCGIPMWILCKDETSVVFPEEEVEVEETEKGLRIRHKNGTVFIYDTEIISITQ